MQLNPADIIHLQHKVAYGREEKAYRQLFVYFHPMLLRFAENLLRSRTSAEDIVSEVMMKLWDMGSRLAQVENLKTYTFTAVKNSVLTKLAQVATEPLNLDPEDCAGHPGSPDPEHLYLFGELQRLIEQAIAQLPPRCQMVYRLIKDEGCSYREVATILSISPNTVEGHMQAAFKKISFSLRLYLENGK